MEFTHVHNLPPADPAEDSWWRCPHCGRDGLTRESTVHLPKCPFPLLEADRLEIERLRADTQRLEDRIHELEAMIEQGQRHKWLDM